MPSLQRVSIGCYCFPNVTSISFIRSSSLPFSLSDLPSLTDLNLHSLAFFGQYDSTLPYLGADKKYSCCSLEMTDLPSLHHIHGGGELQFVNCTVVKLKSDRSWSISSLDICDSIEIDLPASFGNVHTLIAESEYIEWV